MRKFLVCAEKARGLVMKASLLLLPHVPTSVGYVVRVSYLLYEILLVKPCLLLRLSQF